MSTEEPQDTSRDLTQERWELLEQIDAITDKPMIVLSFVWLGLLVLDLTAGLNRPLEMLSYAIWAIFVLDFILELIIAPEKWHYLRRNWLTAVSLLLPALRVLRLFRALRIMRVARFGRSVNLVRLVTSINRGMKAMRHALRRRGVGYVLLLTFVVTAVGAAGMAQFESAAALRDAGIERSGVEGLNSYGEALWWTAMTMTTMGSEYWPKTLEGRILGWLLSLYAFAIFGYITATLASFFIGADVAAREGQSGRGSEVATLTAELADVRQSLARISYVVERQSQIPHEGSNATD